MLIQRKFIPGLFPIDTDPIEGAFDNVAFELLRHQDWRKRETLLFLGAKLYVKMQLQPK